MKTIPFKVFAFFLLFSAFFSCKKTESDTSSINYPIEISYEEYSLEGTQCQWDNIPCNHKVILTISKKEYL